MEWGEFSHSIRHVPHSQQKRIRQAFDLGAYLHRNQLRKSGEPYFIHPIAVAAMLCELSADSDTIIAALLHDALEDTELTLDEVEIQYGTAVSQLIDGVTKITQEELEERPTRDEQIETLRKIFTLMQDDVRIMVIKLIDRLHNMQTIGFLSPERRITFAEETLEVYTKIADRLCMQDLRDELTALSLKQLDSELFGSMEDAEQRQRQSAHDIISRMQSTLSIPSGTHLLYEQKTWPQIRAQLQLNGAVVTGLASLSIVFVCPSLEQCYHILGVLHQRWPREITSFQDFINTPGLNGYRGLHTTIILSDGTRVRCKIRTEEMQEYAHRGITVYCFGGKAQDIASRLPWTQRISPLSVTIGGKEDFWQGLLDDILGESISIHGPGDQNILVPNIATALDAAFYTFHNLALRTQKIMINGKEVLWSTEIVNGDSIEITVADEPSVDRKWLEWTKTGLASTSIRSALSKQSRQQKVEGGCLLLREAFRERKKGQLEEFDTLTLTKKLNEIRISSLEEAFIGIAEGRLDASSITTHLLDETETGKQKIRRTQYVIRFVLRRDLLSRLHPIISGLGSYDMQIRNLHASTTEYQLIRLKISLTSTQIPAIKTSLAGIGASNIDIIPQNRKDMLLTAAVIGLWAVNPVIARWILSQGMSALTLSTIRLLTFFVFATGYFFIWRRTHRNKYSSIPHITKISAFPTIGWMGMTFGNYFSLAQMMPPSVHLLFLRLNTLLLPTFSPGQTSIKMSSPIRLFLIFLASITLFTSIFLGKDISIGIIFSLLALFSYTLYSLSSERALQSHNIDIRQPYLVFQMGMLTGIVGLLIVPFIGVAALSHGMTLVAALYAFIFVCIPHACYSAILKTVRFTYFSDFLLLEPVLAAPFEIAILSIVLPWPMYLLMAIALGLLVYIRRKMIVVPMQLSIQ